MSVFFLKVPRQKMIFNQLITEEPKYQAKALIVATDTIRLTAGAAVVVTIPSNFI